MDIFLYSHHLSAWYCFDIVRRNSALVNHRIYRVKGLNDITNLAKQGSIICFGIKSCVSLSLKILISVTTLREGLTCMLQTPMLVWVYILIPTAKHNQDQWFFPSVECKPLDRMSLTELLFLSDKFKIHYYHWQ